MGVGQNDWGKSGVRIQFSPQNHPENHPKVHPGKSGAGLGCVTVELREGNLVVLKYVVIL